MLSIKNTIREIKDDFPKEKLSFISFCEKYFKEPRFRILLNYRLGKYFIKSRFCGIRQIGILYRAKLITKRNCDISYNSIIGQKLKLPHPIGIVIGNNVIIKDNVTIFQQVTLGSHGQKGKVKGYPTIENNVVIYSGAKVFGDITIGANSIIGANSVVNINIPPNSTVVGIPCKII